MTRSSGRRRSRGARLFAAFALVAAGASLAQATDVFGRNQRGSAALVGIFYDLKQTQQREPIPNAEREYARIVDEFLVAGFDEALFNRFFRAGMPLYTTQIITGTLNADAAPKAFGVESVVKPRNWVVHYKAQIAPPQDGTYRFVGIADNILVVAINQRVVLVSNLPGTAFAKLGWKPAPTPELKPAAQPNSKYGDWVDLKEGQPVDIDILIGERPGGIFYAYLLYQKKGEIYPVNSKGEIILPLFQVARRPMADERYLTNGAPWTAFE